MKKFIERMYSAPFLELMEIQKEQFTIKEFHEGILHIANFGFYLPMPEILRRCYFLHPSEKQVLFELISWACSNKESDEIGYCSVPEPIIRGNTNLSKSSVKKAIKVLREMGFIVVRKYYNGRNHYKINSLAMNPFILLSEYVHYRRQSVFNSWGSDEFMFEEWEGDTLPFDTHSYIEATLEFVNKTGHYMPFIRRIIAAYGENFLEQYSVITSDVNSKIHEIFGKVLVHLKGRI